MKMKIYNKEMFWSGIVVLLLVTISILVTITYFRNLDIFKIIKYIMLESICILFGGSELYRSLCSKYAKEDEQNDDECENLINTKSNSSAFNITLLICATITILSGIAIGVIENNDVLTGIFIGTGIVSIIMKIIGISSYFYHGK